MENDGERWKQIVLLLYTFTKGFLLTIGAAWWLWFYYYGAIQSYNMLFDGGIYNIIERFNTKWL